MKKVLGILFAVLLASTAHAQVTGAVIRYMNWGSYSNWLASMTETNVVIYPTSIITNLNVIVVTNLTVNITTNFSFYSSTNEQSYTIITNSPWLTNVTPAAIVAAGAITNLTVVQPYALNCSPTVSVTKAMINAAPWGEMSLSLTGVVQLFCIDTNTFAAGDVATWAVYFSDTNSITFCTNTITGTAWTNATATGSDRIFRKASGKNTVAIW
jgi:hypothetical protein